MNYKNLVLVLSLLLPSCGGSGSSDSSSFSFIESVSADPDITFSRLGNNISQGNIWSYSGDALWHEVDPGNWRVSITPEGPVEITAFVHIRGGVGGCHSRIYNKLRIVRVLPSYSEQIMINSEALIELASGCLRFFDASRTIVGYDMDPVVGSQNVYAVELVAGDGLHTEISYGSSLRVKPF